MNYYEILGVDKASSVGIIKSAYKSQVLKCHPDKVPPSERASAEEKFKLLTEAYQVLCDPTKRAEYDSSKARFSNFDSQWNVFDDFFSEREFFKDPFSHPFFSPTPFLSRESPHSRDPFFSTDRFFNGRLSDNMNDSSSVLKSTSTFSHNGVTKNITETRQGNTVIREEIISENGNIISRTKTTTQSSSSSTPRRGSFKIHIS